MFGNVKLAYCCLKLNWLHFLVETNSLKKQKKKIERQISQMNILSPKKEENYFNWKKTSIVGKPESQT